MDMDRLPDRQRKVLGKGLSALLPARHIAPEPRQETESARTTSGTPADRISIDRIDPNPLQPRTSFDHDKIEELAASIRAHGVIQPLIVRRKADRFELVAGERRLRAARVAQLTEVPALIQDYTDDRLLEIALVENIQREDLNPIEIAQALDRLARDLKLNHEEIGQRTGKDRVTISNLLRLLRLPSEVQVLVAERRLSMGHARAILGLAVPGKQIQMADQTIAQGLSVRQVERLVNAATRDGSAGESPAGASSREPRQDPNVIAAVRDLESVLGTRVRILEKSAQKGTIQIEYYSQEDLNRIYEILVPVQKQADGAGGRS